MSTHGGDSFPGLNTLFGRVHRVSRSLVPSSRWFRSFVPSFRSLVPSFRSFVPYLQIHHSVNFICVFQWNMGFKSIFHCDAKLLALNTSASPNTKESTFALPIARNTNMLVSLALGDANFLRWPCTFLFFV